MRRRSNDCARWATSSNSASLRADFKAALPRVREPWPAAPPRRRSARLVPIVVTPHRFRTKRQSWSYCGLGVVTRSTSDWVQTPDGGWIKARAPQTRMALPGFVWVGGSGQGAPKGSIVAHRGHPGSASPGEDQTLDIGTKEEGEFTQRDLAANGSQNSPQDKRPECPRRSGAVPLP